MGLGTEGGKEEFVWKRRGFSLRGISGLQEVEGAVPFDWKKEKKLKLS